MTKLNLFRDLLINSDEASIRADSGLRGQLRLGESGALTIDYAPFEHIQHGARLVIAGITPGAQQARNALLAARRALIDGRSDADALREAKVFASFSGPMRANLIAMLDYIGVARILNISSTALLWETRSELVNFTSVLRFPAYLNGKNYSGSPPLASQSLLTAMVDNHLAEEARILPHAIWVPLGPTAASALDRLVEKRLLESENVMFGLPHPSGANAERIAYFLERKRSSDLSSKTSAAKLDATRDALQTQIKRLGRLSPP